MRTRILAISCFALTSLGVIQGQTSEFAPNILDTYKEILTICITDIESRYAVTSQGGKSVSLLSFGGFCDSEYFRGSVLPGAYDCQCSDGGIYTLSARYIMDGVDCAGDSCKIFIENNAIAGDIKSKPKITTDSRALDFLNSSELVGVLDNSGPFTIRIYCASSNLSCANSR